ncbi:phosphomannomutase/phosphoglucomutase [Halanaerobium hydrogeniformans]|uniref:Phosphoglucomutase/phosphomannomutase alpha/beta/alpha domain I n=1 Tax=Halanaerobium hydrogeniformans TaxID=656519 RepID=E4RM85_HALHG|nr:phosphomannomutase/phosphoglucomutase [Halanaerobium hydrogeniformans]ADQ14416.1 phosphoglucomutase/phosphomannomutase alpha/beta/alpha domain I [Halanaerobium hydrogeniformans]
MKAFKAYDIRGVYNKDFNKEDVYKIGYFLPKLLAADKVLVGYDDRESTPELFEALAKGITDQGADVYKIGYATTPMVYYGTAKHNYKASVMITASHNPPEYNGLKISRENALPVGYDSGLKELEEMIAQEEVKAVGKKKKGNILEHDIKNEYLEFLKGYLPDLSELNLAIDVSNGMAAILTEQIFGKEPHYLYNELDGRFPNHEANPLNPENREDVRKLLLEKNSDLALIFDGDGDRVMFLDENGEFIAPDLIIALLAEYFIKQGKGKTILYDIRTSWSVKEHIEDLGGSTHMWKVGHAYAKLKLREIDGICGGELAGHYYYKDFFYCDSGMLTALIVLNVVARLKKEGKSISELIAELDKYANSGEVNFKIEYKQEVMEKLKEHYLSTKEPERFFDFDGYRIEYENWWFNVRPSNTEPYLRLVVEAENQKLLDEKLAEIKSIMNV